MLRTANDLLDTEFVRRVMAPHYSTIGRPSIDPELMVRMLLIGYLNGIRSERRLCEEVHLNLAYWWTPETGQVVKRESPLWSGQVAGGETW
jgi:transposase